MKLRPLLITAIILGVLTAVIFSSCENPFIEKILGPKDDVSTPGGDAVFVAVTDICDVPEIGFVGTPLILSGNVYPPNATYKKIEWFYEGGEDDVGFEIDTLYVYVEATVTVKAVVKNGIAEGEDFEMEFDIVFVIPVDAETPTINSQTETESNKYSQDETVVLEVVAEVDDGGTLSYQWYSNTEKINEGGIEIEGATQKIYNPPTDAVGTFYYYVIVTNTNDNVNREQVVAITSDVMVVVVNEVVYSIGDTGPGGGIIFYHDPNGFTVEGYGNEGDDGYFATYIAYYLEAAPMDFDNVQWGASGIVITDITTFTEQSNALALKKGNGRRDTQIIVDYLGTDGIGTATQLCAVYSSNGKNDWFLPSLGELYLLELDSGYYLSSSQIDEEYAWGMSFLYNMQSYFTKNNSYQVRPIRAF